MKNVLKVLVTCSVLAHCMALDCNAIGVVTPTTPGGILKSQNIQSSGTSTSGANVTVEWRDGSGKAVSTAVVAPRAATPFDWNADFNLPTPKGLAIWGVGRGRCSVSIGGTMTTPTIR